MAEGKKPTTTVVGNKKPKPLYHAWTIVNRGLGATECSPREDSRDPCNEWFEENKKAGALGKGTYRLAAFLAEETI